MVIDYRTVLWNHVVGLLVAAKPDEHLWPAKRRNDRRYQFLVMHNEAYRDQKKWAEYQSRRDKEKREKREGERGSTSSSMSTQVYAVETQVIFFQCDVY